MSELELPKFDQKKCIACGVCVDACPNEVLELIEGILHFARPQDCTYCAACEESCPQGAITCSYEIGWA
jgi:NAD-dependent dihydropyrimidine dehydrogenase PreA subunit